jgi:hypothetical protein
VRSVGLPRADAGGLDDLVDRFRFKQVELQIGGIKDFTAVDSDESAAFAVVGMSIYRYAQGNATANLGRKEPLEAGFQLRPLHER